MIDEILLLKERCNFSDEIGKTFGITVRDASFIEAIHHNTALSSKELADSLDLSPSRGSRIVAKLIDKGLVQAEVDTLDRRATILSLTPEGNRCYDVITKEKQACELLLKNLLTADQIKIVSEGLSLLLQVI